MIPKRTRPALGHVAGQPLAYARGHEPRKRREPRPVGERLLENMHVDADTGCWLWDGATTPRGYGIMYVHKQATHSAYAHRASYEHFVGPIHSDFTIDHLCRNTLCINPEHLQAVTQAENNSRARASQELIYQRGIREFIIHAFESHDPEVAADKVVEFFALTKLARRKLIRRANRRERSGWGEIDG